MPSNALAALDPEYLIERIANGAFLRDLSAETGIDKRRLSEQLRKYPEYAAAKEASIECQLDDAERLIAYAEDSEDIARAREVWKSATWRAERECSHRWGQKQEIKHTGAIILAHVERTDLSAIIAQAEGVVDTPNGAPLQAIEGECERTPDSQVPDV